MANYCTQFSEVIPHLTADEVAWLQRAFGPGGFDKSIRAAWAEEFGALWGEVMGPTFDYAFDEDAESGAHLWVYSEEGGDVDQVIRLVNGALVIAPAIGLKTPGREPGRGERWSRRVGAPGAERYFEVLQVERGWVFGFYHASLLVGGARRLPEFLVEYTRDGSGESCDRG